MQQIVNPRIVLREHLTQTEYCEITALEAACTAFDGAAFKLELDFKLAQAAGKIGGMGAANELLYYDGDRLIGYLGISAFGGDELEVNGMVRPDYRGQGVFRRLYAIAQDEFRRRSQSGMLLLCDRNATAGQAFIRGTGATFHHAEHEMSMNRARTPVGNSIPVTLRRATPADADEVARQDALYSDGEGSHASLQELEQGGMQVYIAEDAGRVVGKVHLELLGNEGGIYGIGILPELRGRGYGRGLLLAAVARLTELGADAVRLQVYVSNANALHIYESCGFETVNTMDYYLVKK